MICSFTKGQEFNPKRSRIRVVKMERFFIDIPIVCKQCFNPLCVSGCPIGALIKEKDHTIYVDEKICTGCGNCVNACPFGAISLDPITNMAIVCDLCNGSPSCVKWCPTKALEFVPGEIGPQRKRWFGAFAEAKSLLDRWSIPFKEFEEYYEKK